jgi:DNA-binding PadR family transcriptional regulator
MSRQPIAPDDAGGDAHLQGMPAEHALLGLLAASASGSGHGYDLARHFGPGAPLGNVLRLEPGMVYHHLKKLERLGWVAALADTTAGRPSRRVFALTDAGRDELDRWLAEPVAHTREIRLEFLAKLYFALLLDPRLALRLIDDQRDMCRRILDSLADRREGDEDAARDDPRTHRFGALVLDMRMAQTQAALTWLDSVRRDAMVAAQASGRQDEPRSGEPV